MKRAKPRKQSASSAFRGDLFPDASASSSSSSSSGPSASAAGGSSLLGEHPLQNMMNQALTAAAILTYQQQAQQAAALLATAQIQQQLPASVSVTPASSAAAAAPFYWQSSSPSSAARYSPYPTPVAAGTLAAGDVGMRGQGRVLQTAGGGGGELGRSAGVGGHLYPLHTLLASPAVVTSEVPSLSLQQQQQVSLNAVGGGGGGLSAIQQWLGQQHLPQETISVPTIHQQPQYYNNK